MTVIETARLILRRMTTDDAPFMLSLLNDETFHRYIGDRGVRTVGDAAAYITNGPVAMYVRHGFGLYLVLSKATGEPMGICGVLKRETLQDVDIGFAFMPKYCGHGYAFESAVAVVDYSRAVLGLTRLVAVVQPDNERSLRLLAKMGFREEGTVRLAADAEALLLLGASLQPVIFGFCTHCGQQVDAYEASTVEPGNPAGDRTYYCRPCGQEWPAPSIYAPGARCDTCGANVPLGLRHCGACGRATLVAWSA